MSRADELRAKLDQLHQATPIEGKPAPRPKGSVETTRKVRRSVDLSQSHHRKLTEWCSDTAAELGVSRVTGADAIRTLVARLLTDETLARKIRADLADDLDNR